MAYDILKINGEINKKRNALQIASNEDTEEGFDQVWFAF